MGRLPGFRVLADVANRRHHCALVAGIKLESHRVHRFADFRPRDLHADVQRNAEGLLAAGACTGAACTGNGSAFWVTTWARNTRIADDIDRRGLSSMRSTSSLS